MVDEPESAKRLSTTYFDLLTPVNDIACGKYNSLILIAGKVYSAGDTWNGIAGVISINKDERIGTPRYITYF